MTGRPSIASNQRGVVLAVALIFLLVLTLIGVSVIGTSSLEERMAGNLQAHTQAFQAAETGIWRAFGPLLSDISGLSSSMSCTSSDEYVDQGTVGGFSSVKTCLNFESTLAGGGDRDSTKDRGAGTMDDPATHSESTGACAAASNYFDIESVGDTTTFARATVIQGIRVPGAADTPGCNNVLTETGAG